MIPTNRWAKLALETTIFLGSLTYAPPLATAIFPQTGRTPVDKLEMQFRNLKDTKGNRISELYYNKGL
jgi:hypothetical protein